MALAASAGELFDSKGKIKSSHTSELVIALCGPIGSPLHDVAQALKERLEQEFAYDHCTIIRLSKIIEDKTTAVADSSVHQRTKKLIEQGDNLRAKYGASVLAELAVSQIVLDRQKAKATANTDRYRILPFDGVAPNRYLKLFQAPKNSRKSGGKMVKKEPKTAEPRFDKTLEALPTLEALVVNGLKEKKLVDAGEADA
jgi:hypothetical protein